MQDGGEPLNIVDEVIRGRKRKKKASDEQIDHDVYNLVAQVGTQQGACAGSGGWLFRGRTGWCDTCGARSSSSVLHTA